MNVHDFSDKRLGKVKPAKKAAGEQGDAWLWVATCADTKLVPSWLVGGRDSDTAIVFTDDLQGRLAKRVQITSEGHKAYLDAIATSFGGDVDYAMLIKIYGPTSEHPQRRYSPAECTGARKVRIRGDSWQPIGPREGQKANC